MRIVFMGSAPIACTCLGTILEKRPGEIVGVVCQPDRPKGRALQMAACPVKAMMESGPVPILTPAKVNAPESLDAIRRLAPDLVAVVAYGQILRRELLALPPLGCVNIHASLLPKYRGAAPIQWAVAYGERETGVTSMFMNEKMDAGDIILQRKLPIGLEDTAGIVHDALAHEGALALVETLELLRSGRLARTQQDETLVTFAPKLSREDGRINWTLSAEAIYNRVRGFNPWPGCHCVARVGPKAERCNLKIWKCRVEARPPTAEASVPGQVLEAAGDGPLVAAGRDAVRLIEVQPEGRKVMTGDAFLRGHGLHAGQFLESATAGTADLELTRE